MIDTSLVNDGFLITANLLNDDNGETTNISECVQSIMVRHRYIEDCFPLYTINLKTTENIRNQIRDDNFHIYLRIATYNLLDSTDSNNNTDDGNVAETDTVFEGQIRIYEKPFETTASKIEEESDSSENQMTSVPFFFYTISGIPENVISKNETCVNNIFSDCTLSDALIYTLTNIDKEDKLNIQEPTNREYQTNILIPPVSLLPAIDFMDSNYDHFYKNNANIYMDNGNFYMYDPLSEEMPKSNIIEATILDTTATDSLETSMKLRKDENNNLLISYRKMPPFSVNNKLAFHNLGSQTIYYYYDDNFNLVSREKENDKSYEKVRYIWEEMKDHSSEVLDKSASMVLVLSDISPKLINPFTLVRIISSQYKECEGDYIISEMAYIFTSSDGKHFKNTINLKTLKR